jgi:hypothetical protein
MPVHPALHRVDVNEGQLVRAGQQPGPPRQPGQQLPVHLLQLAHITEGEGAQERSERARRPDPGEQIRHRAVAQQVHVIDRVSARGHPATRQPIFTSGYTPVFAEISTCRRIRPARPARSARDITGTSPARDTRFGSSNDADIFSGSCHNCIYQVPF